MLVIAGPTASGKSALALAAAQRLDGVVINADSMQVYKRLRILTARPTPEDEAAAPHRLYGWLEPSDACSAGRWREAALNEIAAAHAAGRLPILCGGTGFYLEALMHGLPDAPAISPDIRASARKDAETAPERWHGALAAVDPATASRIRPSDPQRLARALEVWRAAGRPPSEVLDRAAEPPADLDFQVVLLAPDRAWLYNRIDARAAEMAAAGAAEEARAFMALDLDPTLPAAKAVGLREFADAALDATLLPKAIERTAQASRRYAKRQTTWFRHRLSAMITIEAQLSSDFIGVFVLKLEELALTKA